MRDSWNHIDPDHSNGPIGFGIKIILIIFILGAFASVIGYGMGWFGETAQVAREEFGPRALLQKYEWFKDVSAQLDAKTQNIEAMSARLTGLEQQYSGVARNQWQRADVEQYNLWQSEIAGLKANYNDLAAQYNANMVKFNFRFTNVGDLPEGATSPLPRAYKPYMK